MAILTRVQRAGLSTRQYGRPCGRNTNTLGSVYTGVRLALCQPVSTGASLSTAILTRFQRDAWSKRAILAGHVASVPIRLTVGQLSRETVTDSHYMIARALMAYARAILAGRLASVPLRLVVCH